jgi:phosphoglycerate dehydrogenase-like enzyme
MVQYCYFISKGLTIMAKLNVLVIRKLGDKYLKQIDVISPDNINLIDASAFFYTEPGEDSASRHKIDALLANADIVVGHWPPRDIVTRAPNLKWFHTMLAGVDAPDYARMLEKGITVTNSTGIHGVQISELVFEKMLIHAKRAFFSFQMQQEKKWSRFVPGLLTGKTIGIVGLGSIGKEVARLGKAFGMKVIANRRSVKQITKARNVDILMPSNQLIKLLSQSDYVVLSMAVTPETDKIIGEKELRSMKPTAFLINVARGKVVDEEMLIRALQEKWIAGAGLDTVSQEPLPLDSKLWELPNVILTPHISGVREDYFELAVPLFCENLKRYLSGKKMHNVIDRKKGY